MVTPAARREATTYLRRTFEMKERIGTDPTSERYRGVRPEDGALRERLKALAQERRRFGYRRLHVRCGAKAMPSTGSGFSASTARSG